MWILREGMWPIDFKVQCLFTSQIHQVEFYYYVLLVINIYLLISSLIEKTFSSFFDFSCTCRCAVVALIPTSPFGLVFRLFTSIEANTVYCLKSTLVTVTSEQT